MDRLPAHQGAEGFSFSKPIDRLKAAVVRRQFREFRSGLRAVGDTVQETREEVSLALAVDDREDLREAER